MFEEVYRSADHAQEARGSARLLIVDDHAEMRALLAEILGLEGYTVAGAGTGAEMLVRLRNESFAAILLDKNIPDLTGLDLLPGVRVICPEVPVILITAFWDVASFVDAIEKGVFAYLLKPFRVEELLKTLEQALAQADRAVPSPSTPGGTR
jgi:DNA-binding NtrC family response regulator